MNTPSSSSKSIDSLSELNTSFFGRGDGGTSAFVIDLACARGDGVD